MRGWVCAHPNFVKIITKYMKKVYFAPLILYIFPPQHIEPTGLGFDHPHNLKYFKRCMQLETCLG